MAFGSLAATLASNGHGLYVSSGTRDLFPLGLIRSCSPQHLDVRLVHALPRASADP
jgi:hypothetical protein